MTSTISSLTLEAELTPEEIALQQTVHRFSEDVMRPAGIALDALADPADVIAKGSVLWDVFDQHAELGLEALWDPRNGLSVVQRARMSGIIAEELGWGDTGLAISLSVSDSARRPALLSRRPDLIERFAAPGSIGCLAVTEPDHGSDQIRHSVSRTPIQKPNCVARKRGTDWRISGQRAAWVSNGSIADAALLVCAIDEGSGAKSLGSFLVDLRSPGVSRGKPLDKLGQRALNQGEIYFDDVLVPGGNLLAAPSARGDTRGEGLGRANSHMGAVFVGLAQAALDFAVDYAKHRVQGGVPIIEHQSVQSRLFEMFRKVECARALSRRVLIAQATHGPRVEYGIASKVTSTQTAFDVASAAVQIYGGCGLAREFPVEKLLRDARASMIEDGCNEVLGLIAASRF